MLSSFQNVGLPYLTEYWLNILAAYQFSISITYRWPSSCQNALSLGWPQLWLCQCQLYWCKFLFGYSVLHTVLSLPSLSRFLSCVSALFPRDDCRWRKCVFCVTLPVLMHRKPQYSNIIPHTVSYLRPVIYDGSISLLFHTTRMVSSGTSGIFPWFHFLAKKSHQLVTVNPPGSN